MEEADFRQLLVTISDWYNQRYSIRKLKVLYSDHLKDSQRLEEAKNMNQLLEWLIGTGDLSSTNLTLLYETIRVTNQSELWEKVKDDFPPYIPENGISNFSLYRRNIIKFGTAIKKGHIAKIKGLDYRTSFRKYPDSWSLIMDLEQKKIICEKNIDIFIKKLECNGLYTAAAALGVEFKGIYLVYELQQFLPILSLTLITVLVLAIILQIPRCTGQSELNACALSLSLDNTSVPDVISEDTAIMKYLTESQKTILEKETSTVQLTMWNPDGFQIYILEIFTDLVFVKSERRHGQQHERALIEKTGKPATLQDILGVIKSIDSCKVLITSKGGMGKTTLLRYIAYNWATNSDNTSIFADKLVFFIPVRDIKAGKTILDVIVQNIDLEHFSLDTNLPKDPRLIKKFVQNHNDKVVFLFDGLDELESGAESPVSIFMGIKLSNCTVILTSRAEHVTSVISSSDVHVKVEGFSPSNIKRYIEKHFKYIGKPKLGQQLIEAFKLNSPFYHEWGGYNKAAFDLCSSPFLLLKICTIWEKKQYLPGDLTCLYKEVFCCILNQYINKRRKDEGISSFDEIPMKYTSAILVLGGAIYKGLQKNILFINKNDITEANEKESVNLGLKLGFVYKEMPVEKDDFIKRYGTHHKLLSEALAGFYLSYKIQREVWMLTSTR